MQNLEQIRAATAVKQLPQGRPHLFDRSDVVGIPALILNNGLLATAAFCCEKDASDKPKRQGMMCAFNSIASHLQERGITTVSATGHELIRDLANRDNLSLQRATAEALAFLAFLKRFALKEKDSGKTQNP